MWAVASEAEILLIIFTIKKTIHAIKECDNALVIFPLSATTDSSEVLLFMHKYPHESLLNNVVHAISQWC